MFGKEIDVDKIKPYCSKISAKMIAMQQFPNDLERAEKLYNFLVKDMDLPDFESPTPTGFEQVKNMVGDTMSWLKNNKDDISEIMGMIKGVRNNIAPADVPQLNQ